MLLPNHTKASTNNQRQHRHRHIIRHSTQPRPHTLYHNRKQHRHSRNRPNLKNQQTQRPHNHRHPQQSQNPTTPHTTRPRYKRQTTHQLMPSRHKPSSPIRPSRALQRTKQANKHSPIPKIQQHRLRRQHRTTHKKQQPKLEPIPTPEPAPAEQRLKEVPYQASSEPPSQPSSQLTQPHEHEPEASESNYYYHSQTSVPP